MKNIKKYYSFITENKIVKNKNNYWTKERLQEEADKYLTRGDFWNNSSTAAGIALSKKLMDELFNNHNNK